MGFGDRFMLALLYPFFALTAQSPTRQTTFRVVVTAHLAALGGVALLVMGRQVPPHGLGHVLLVAGIVEGAILIGWRLTQLPKSQALEFLLVTPLPPGFILVAEGLVGICRLALVTICGLPILVLLAVSGFVGWLDLSPLLGMPLTWGALTGLGLTAWSYEPLRVRRWAERITLGGLVLYVGIGVFAGEHLREWVAWLPADLGRWFMFGYEAFHRYNPFGVMQFWFTEDALVAFDRTVGLEMVALIALVAVIVRAAARVKGHFHERHYQPAVDLSRKNRGVIGDRPLSWWAVRRVREFSGRINLWLAGGFGLMYSAYTVAESVWPPWMGRLAFAVIDQAAGGIPGVVTAMVVLAAVPAAFQYGLWDSNAHERCKRLELLLLTELSGSDYWKAAAAAAWERGRGYFAVAVLLLAAAGLGGRMSLGQVATALAAATVLWGLYFTLGFWAFSRGFQANRLGGLLTIAFPLITFICYRADWSFMGGLFPPGVVYGTAAGLHSQSWFFGLVIGAGATVLLARSALAQCDGRLRVWYQLHHGRKILD
jgi:hypothetical protein